MSSMAQKTNYVKVHSSVLNVLMLFVSTIYGAGGLRATELRITPRVVHKGRDVTLACLYQPQDSGIYSVKWYRGSSEFYRYSPLETPNTRVTPVPGIYVDASRSNASQAVLVAAAMSLAGNYSCEVILHAPYFPNSVASARLDVIGAGGLRATELRISPPIVQRGSDATLACLYELHDAPLYSVKWYRGRHEFYRYSPTEEPDTKIFPFAGINVDLARSNESQVVLTRVSFGLSGNFSCEVTADSPSFATSIVSNQMEVVVLPAWPPRVQTERVNYSPGDVLLANCSSPPSRPQAALTFYINEVTIRPGQLRVQQAGEGLSWSELSIAIQLLPAHYERGAPVLRCEATVADLYSEGTQLALYPANGDPKIERVTSPGSTGPTLEATTILVLLGLSIISCISRKINT